MILTVTPGGSDFLICSSFFLTAAMIFTVFAPAGHADLADSINRLEHTLDLLVGDFGCFAKALVSGDHQRDHRIGIGIGLLNNRRKNIWRQVSKRAGNFFANVLGCAFDLALEQECASDSRAALGRLGTYLIETADLVHC